MSAVAVPVSVEALELVSGPYTVRCTCGPVGTTATPQGVLVLAEHHISTKGLEGHRVTVSGNA